MIGVAVQGAGNVSTEHIRAFMANPHTQVVAIGSRTKEGAARKAQEMGLDCAVYDDYEALLRHPGVDIVAICTPPHRHAEECIAAAQHGKHVLIEKPVAVNEKDLVAMAQAVRQAGVGSAVGFVLRWNPLLRTIRESVSKGLIGRPLLVQADYWHGPSNTRIEWNRNWSPASLGALVHGGCHAMDAARFVLGDDRIVQVSGVSTEDEQDASNKQLTVATARFAGGAVAKVSASTRFFMPYVFNIEVFGDEGAIRNNRLYTKQLPGQLDFAEIPTVIPDSGAVSHHPFQGLIDHLVDSIRAGVETENNLEAVINTHQACFAAEESAANGSIPVSLE